MTRTRKSQRKSSTLQRLRRRDLILLLGVLTLACVSVMVVTGLILRSRPPVSEVAVAGTPGPAITPGPQPTHTVTYVQVTGLNQYALARDAARAWAPDAQLASASTDWPRVFSVEQVGEPTLWSYRFYSPAKKRLLFVTVEPDGAVNTIEHVVEVTLPPRQIEPERWLIDSPAALATWLDYGGAKMLQTNPGLELLAQLRVTSGNPELVWVVVGLDKRTEDVWLVVIDAGQGQVTKTTPPS